MIGNPSSENVGACKDACVPPEIAGECDSTQSMMNCIASVTSARYSPFTRSAATENTDPITAADNPPISSASDHGTPNRAAWTAE